MSGDRLFKNSTKCLIECLDKTINSSVIDGGISLVYLVLGSELVKLICFECRFVIGENMVRDSELVNDVALK